MSSQILTTTYTSSDSLIKNNLSSEELINPFVHHLELTSTYEKIKTGFFTVVVLPIRLFFISWLLVAVWLLACVGLFGLTEEELREKPLTGWRRVIREWMCYLGRAAYHAGGMQIIVKGRQVSRAEAPILVIAPHSTFLDANIAYVAGLPSIIVRKESGLNPFVGKLINYTQPVYVWRDDPNSRQKTIQEIIYRAKSELDWPQMLIFPEGTCTNRSCLITFKPGAFYPGVPVQPVLLRYPNKLDTVTWTWDGPGAWKLLWLTLTQSHSSCEIEFLPVYTPSEEEKADPKLYAHNVRLLMAKALGVPTTNYTYEDCILSSRAKELNIPVSSIIIQTYKLRSRLGLVRRHTEKLLLQENPNWLTSPDEQNVTFDKFSTLLNVPDYDPYLIQLFQLYVKDPQLSDVIDFRKYLLSVSLAFRGKQGTNLVKLAFELCGSNINVTKFISIMGVLMNFTDEEAQQLFHRITSDAQSCITYGAFKKLLLSDPDLMNSFEFLIPFSHFTSTNNNNLHPKQT